MMPIYNHADYVTRYTDNWATWLGHLYGTPCNMLEVGCFEGRSACWWFTNVCTHPASTLTCIDPWLGKFNEANQVRFMHNTSELPGSNERLFVGNGKSDYLLPRLPRRHYDAIYIDGSHEAEDVMGDAVNAMHLVRTGGVIIFDDYGFSGEGKKSGPPKPAIDAFLSVYAYRLQVLHVGWQVAVRVVS